MSITTAASGVTRGLSQGGVQAWLRGPVASGVAEKFQWGILVSVWRQNLQPQEANGGLGAKPPALADFCNFSIKITLFYAYFSQNSYFKIINYQFKAFKISLNVLNRINKEQVL